MPYFKSPIVNTYYEIFGENHQETLVLISGLNTQMTSWDTEFIEHLVLSKFRVIIFDNRDCGKSTVILNPATKNKNLTDFLLNPHHSNIEYTLWDMAGDIYNLLNRLNIIKAHIIGRSMGGIIAQLFAYQYPNIVESLTLIMSSSFNPALPKSDDRLIEMMTNETVSYTQNSALYIKNKIEFLKLIHGKTYSIDIAKEQELIMRNEERKSTQIRPFRQIVALISYTYDVSILNQILAPSLIIHGDEDLLFSLESAYDLRKNIRNSELIIKKGMGHSIPSELSASIVQDITTFITKNLDQQNKPIGLFCTFAKYFNKMNTEIIQYKPELKNQLLEVWEKSVLATHHFLKKEDFLEIKAMLQAFDFTKLDVFCLMTNSKIVGFIGLQQQKIEMLFLNPESLGKGYGRQLIHFAFTNYKVNSVDVNVQNTDAILFYKRMGFEIFDRSELDDMGKSYPIFKMKLNLI